MIITIEGPDKCGKSFLIESIMSGFWEEKSKLLTFSSKDKDDGWGYLRAFVKWLDHPLPSVWHRSWISEYIYGNLLFEKRQFAADPFLAEWFYGRALEGRGGKFIVLPSDSNELAERRDESDFSQEEVNSIDEYKLYKMYAERWGYEILINDYTPNSSGTNAVTARKSIFIPTHKMPSTEYIGSLNPLYTFVGQSRNEFPFDNRPFFTRSAAEYFRQFGLNATQNFGYSSIEGYRKNSKKYPHLFKRTIGLGGAANLTLPELPNVAIGYTMPTKGEEKGFLLNFAEVRANHFDDFPRVL